jgi:hypothetical protein
VFADFISANRNRFVGNVWKRGQQIVHTRLGLRAQLIEFSDSILQPADFSASRFCFVLLTFLHQCADLSTRRVALCIELIRFANHPAPFFVGACEIVERCCVCASRIERLTHLFDIFSDVIEVQHLCQYRISHKKAQNEFGN